MVIGADLGATSMQVAVMRPDLTVLARHREPIDMRQGPGVILARLRERCLCGAKGLAGDVGPICAGPSGTRCHCGNQGW